MTENFRSWCRRFGLGGLTTFVAIVVIEHALQPGLDPATHQVSEYANGSRGWLMVLGFLAWSASLLATAGLAAAEGKPERSAILSRSRLAVLVIAAGGMFVTACFATQTSAGKLPPGVTLTWSGRLHDLGSGVATLALVAAAVASIVAGDGSRKYRLATSTILLTALASDAILLAVGSSVGGLRQRILLACAALWQLFALREWAPHPRP